MKTRIFLFSLSQIFLIAKAESSFGLKLGNSINKSRISTVGEDLYDNFFNLPYAEVFLNKNGHGASVGFGFGNHGYKGEIYGDWVYIQLPRSKFQLSYQNTKVLSKFLIPPGLKS